MNHVDEAATRSPEKRKIRWEYQSATVVNRWYESCRDCLKLAGWSFPYALVSAIHSDWLILSNYRLLVSDNFCTDSNQTSWMSTGKNDDSCLVKHESGIEQGHDVRIYYTWRSSQLLSSHTIIPLPPIPPRFVALVPTCIIDCASFHFSVQSFVNCSTRAWFSWSFLAALAESVNEALKERQ